jgi:hypothetical protein
VDFIDQASQDKLLLDIGPYKSNVFVADHLLGFGQRTDNAVAHEGKDRADCFFGWHMLCVRQDETRDAPSGP